MDAMKNRKEAAEWLSWVARIIILAGDVLASYFCLAGMLILVISDPILRYVLGTPLYWSNEVSTFLMVMMVFSGLGVSFARGKHVRVTLIFNKLSEKAQRVLWVFVSLITLCYIGFLLYAAIRLACSSLKYKVVSPTAELPFFPFQMFMVFGLIVFFAAVAAFVVKRVGIFLKVREEHPEEKGLIDLGF